MKTKRSIFKLILGIAFIAAAFFSCDNPVALGTKLDLLGPVVTIISPSQRQSVPAQFEIEGTVSDESSIDRMVISAVTRNKDFPRQWRNKKGAWEISDDYGATWSPYESKNSLWRGTDNIEWKITIDMNLAGHIQEGEYTFNIQAWDKGGFTDDNSFKAIVLIVDLDPPKVVITNPYLYDMYALDSDPTFKKLHEIPDASDEWQDTSYLGKFITQEFSLKWQIEDSNDVWSIDIRFYNYDIEIDNNPLTLLPDDYIYRYYENTPPPPKEINPNDYVKLNGSVTVPNLYDEEGTYDGGGELKKRIPEKTTVKVVAVCYDSAGNPNQEKTLGYYISWPKANSPWIVFTEGIEPPDNFYGRRVAYDKDDPNVNQDYIEKDVFTVYPGRSVKATAFQAHGVKEVKYSLYKCDVSGNKLNRPDEAHPLEEVEIGGKKQINIVRANTLYGDTYSTIFPWEINVPPITGYYIFTAEAFSSQGKSNEDYDKKYVMLFRVHDITFPDFTEGPFPVATDPLFLDIKNNKITIHGVVSDATNVVSLCLVWIDPESKDFAAMSQLSYFRDKDYKGWHKALGLTPGTSALENIGEAYDDEHRNRLWMINLSPATPPIDNETNRRRFSYSQEIDLTDDLNIAADKQPLKSQVFLLRAQNPDGKCTIVTYAPQGDTLAPEINITRVVISRAPKPFIPKEYAVVPQFLDGDTITIEGTWREDSLEILPIDDYFKENFNITINNIVVMDHDKKMPPVLTINPDKTTGTWTLTATVKTATTGPGQIALAVLKDTLVIGANVKDIGGNVSETGCSWLILSDNLRLMRISSEKDDGTYSAGEIIDIFLEFSKPVRLTNPVSGKKPELILSSASGNAARAVYNDGQINQNSRQYFTYTIGTGHGTKTGEWLNVTSIYYDGVVYSTSTSSNGKKYPFSWSRGELEDDGSEKDGYEEVRITMEPGHYGNKEDKIDYNKEDKIAGYYLRTLPTATATNDPDYQFTLTAGKHIAIDTAAPVIDNIWANTSRGYYNAGDIYLTVNFNKPVGITGVPRLVLQVTNGGSSTVLTSSNAGDVRVSENQITFVYSIKPGDTTSGNAVVVSGYNNDMGTISDLAGNPLTSIGGPWTLEDASSTPGNDKKIYIETLSPGTPIFRILSTYMNNPTQSNQCITQNINGTNRYGSSSNVVDLLNVYNDDLWYTVQGNTTGDNATTPYKVGTLEYAYSTNFGESGESWSSWVAFANTTNEPQVLNQTGKSTFKARQKDKAGNVSAETNTVTLNWDKGTLINRISSNSANGTYTNTTSSGGTRVDEINITVYFRKKVKFSASPTLTLNTTPAATVTLSGYTAGTPVDNLSFTYSVGASHNPGGSAKLNVEAFNLNGGNAQDEDNVRVNNLLSLPQIGSGSQLSELKDIYVQTGPLTVSTSLASNKTLISGGGVATDGSYNTALTITFNRNIIKGNGNITIIQPASDYRLPAVLTESQFNKYNNILNVNNWYTRGSNGYNYTSANNRSADTTTKYILKYSVIPEDITPNASGTEIEKLAEAFRQAEKIELSVNAQAVKISGAQLIIELTGSNALQVPGAVYQVTYPAGFVQDSLNTPCRPCPDTVAPVQTGSVTLDGIAKPFIRINKKQETITVNNNPSVTQPRLVAAQPFQADVRFDTRTPGATIYYFTTDVATNISGGGNNNNTATTANWTTANGPGDLNAAAPAQPNDPQPTTGQPTAQTTNPITIGDNNYQGLQWYVRVKATKNSEWSVNSEEMAFRTVVTYNMNNMADPNDATQQRPGSGDQLWIRGGDAIQSSSVPGFPLTWDIEEFDRAKAEKKRAGIRLFTKTGNGNVYNDIWKWITWDINTDAYFDIILGRDEAADSTAEEAQQYGPRRFAYQRAGWTSWKEQCRILPGKHRWLVSDNPTPANSGNKGATNFSAIFHARPKYNSADITWTP